MSSKKVRTLVITIRFFTEHDLWSALRGIFLKNIAIAAGFGKGPESKFVDGEQERWTVNSEIKD